MSFGTTNTPPTPPPKPTHWREQAACAGMDLNLWFPTETGSGNSLQARLICRSCPVREPCLEYAITNKEHHGIWGGMSEKQRQDLRRSRNIQIKEHGTHNGYNAHIRRRENPCDPCRAAHTRYTAEIRAARRKNGE